MRTVVNVSEQVAPFYYKYFMDWATPNQVIYGGRACTKTVCNAWKIATKIADPNSKTSVVVIRQTLNTHRDSTYAELIKALDTIGIKYKSTYNPMEIRVGENIVYFRCLDDYEKLKGMTSSKSPIKIAWFFEITEFAGAYEMTQVKSTLARGGDKDFFISLYEFNPAPHKTHWTYAWIDRYSNNKDYSFQHNTYEDLPQTLKYSWLGKHLLREIEVLKMADFETYKQIYLGLPAQVSGAVYKKFTYDTHVKNYDKDIKPFINSKIISIGVDYGETDATTAVACEITTERQVFPFDEYYHKNGVSTGLKDINDYADDISKFVIRIVEQNPTKRVIVYIDSASKSLYTLVYKLLRGYRVTVSKINKSKKMKSLKNKSALEERIYITNIMLGSGYLYVGDKCQHLIQALETAEYHPDTGIRLDNGTYNIDSIDAFEYSWLEYLLEIYDYIIQRISLKEEGEENNGEL